METLVSLVAVAGLVCLLIPMLSSARTLSHRDQCVGNLRAVGQGWSLWLEDHDQTFPLVLIQPGWRWGGVRFSSINDSCFPDYDRPLSTYLSLPNTDDYDQVCVCCPADRGISDSAAMLGTGTTTAFRSFGTSYRANAALLSTRSGPAGAASPDDELRGLRRDEIAASPSKLVLAGDPVWFEVAETTGRNADWHSIPSSGNILFLDGSVRFITVRPHSEATSILFDIDSVSHDWEASPDR